MLGKTNISNRIIWILLAFFGWYILMGEIFMIMFEKLIRAVFKDPSAGLLFVNEFYAPLFASCLFFVVMCLLVKKNRFMIGIVRPTRDGRSMKMLGFGILLGFLTNFFCILCALLHGDIKLYLDFSAAEIPLMIYAFICVFFQSTSEELWCRTFMYERLNVHYPLWVAIVVNGTVFGLLHSFNTGITVLAMADLIICGLAYSLLRWYSGSIWIAMGIHTGWNFTQNYLFGLPNSGLVSEASVFHLGAANGTTTWVYDWVFGVEGGIPALFIDGLLGVTIIYLACRNGRIKELGMNRVKTLEAHGLKMRVEEAAPVTPVNVEPEDSAVPETVEAEAAQAENTVVSNSKPAAAEAAPAETVVEEYTEE